jgi:DNA repair protein RadC
MPEAVPKSALSIPIYRVTLVRESALAYHEVPQIRSSKDVANLLRAYLKEADREYFVVFFLDQKNRLTGIHTVSMGSLTASVVHPREVFKGAILAQAAAIIGGHNHPSGDIQPSREDRALTTRLYQAGKLLGINMLDHIIVGSEGNYFSFADEGLLDAKGD